MPLPLGKDHGDYRLARDGLLQENNNFAGSNIPKYTRAQEELDMAAELEALAEVTVSARL